MEEDIGKKVVAVYIGECVSLTTGCRGVGEMIAGDFCLDNGQTCNRVRDLAVDRSPAQVTGNGRNCDYKFWRFAIYHLCRKCWQGCCGGVKIFQLTRRR